MEIGGEEEIAMVDAMNIVIGQEFRAVVVVVDLEDGEIDRNLGGMVLGEEGEALVVVAEHDLVIGTRVVVAEMLGRRLRAVAQQHP